MVIRTAAQRTGILAGGRLYGHVVDAGNAHAHQPFAVKLPVLITIRAEMLAAVVAKLVGKAYCDAVLVEGPHFLDETIVELTDPFSCQERDDLLTALEEL